MDENRYLELLDEVLLEATSTPGFYSDTKDGIFVESSTMESISKFYKGLVNNLTKLKIDILDTVNDSFSDDKADYNKEKDKPIVNKLFEKCAYLKSHNIKKAEVKDYSMMRDKFASYVSDLSSLSSNMLNRTFESLDDCEETLSDYKNTIKDMDIELDIMKNRTKYLQIEEIERILARSKSKADVIQKQSDALFHIISSFGKKSLEIKKKDSDDPVDGRTIFLFNTCSSKTFKFMIKWIQFFGTHADIEFD